MSNPNCTKDTKRGLNEAFEKRMARLREQFKTCTYPNSGAYSPIKGKNGNLKEKKGDYSGV